MKNILKSYVILVFCLVSCNSGDVINETSKSEKETKKSYSDSLRLAKYLAKMNSDSCKNANDSARREASKGNYYYTSEGTVIYDEFEAYFHKYMLQNYNIEMHATCIGLDYSIDGCFKRTAKIEIEKKFGKDFINNCYITQKEKFDAKKKKQNSH
jgi:hypothetical protein